MGTETVKQEKSIQEYGRTDINQLLIFMKQSIGIDDFKESALVQRRSGKNLIDLMNKIQRDEFIKRFRGILEDDFKYKNCNSIRFVYKEIKAFINKPNFISHSPLEKWRTLNDIQARCEYYNSLDSNEKKTILPLLSREEKKLIIELKGQ